MRPLKTRKSCKHESASNAQPSHEASTRRQALTPKPVNNARADKLDDFMWRYSFAERHCLIPVTAFAEAEGEKGAKTRTWFSMPDNKLFAIAGLWRDSPE